jgi:2-methylcitrate dehydratase PrpD
MLAEPLEQKRRPATAIDAKFSLPFTVATALCKRDVGLDDFTTEALRDPGVLALAQRVQFHAEAGRDAPSDMLRGSVALTLRDGRRLKLAIDEPAGSVRRPASDEALLAKFADCARRARSAPDAPTIDRWAKRILSLESCEDVGRELAATL